MNQQNQDENDKKEEEPFDYKDVVRDTEKAQKLEDLARLHEQTKQFLKNAIGINTLGLPLEEIEDVSKKQITLDDESHILIICMKKLLTKNKEKFHVSQTYRNLKPMWNCLLYTSPSPRDKRQSRMPSSA